MTEDPNSEAPVIEEALAAFEFAPEVDRGPGAIPPPPPPPPPAAVAPLPPIAATPLVTAAPPATRTLPFVFTGTGAEYFRIWIVNVVLSVLTLGVYSAWAKCRSRQYFYGHTSLDGSAFEYLADPLQILKGRIIVAFILGLLVAAEALSPVVYLLLLGALVLATPLLMVSAFRFNARNSAWRNVRFGFEGTVEQAYKTYLNIVGLSMLTCGLAAPYTQWLWSEFIVGKHRFGDETLSWRTKANDFITLYIYMVPMSIALYVLLFGGITVATAGAQLFAGDAAPADTSGGAGAAMSAMMMVVMGLFYALVTIPTAFFRARMANLVLGGIGLGPHELRSEQKFGELLKVYLLNIVTLVFSLGLAWPWAKVRLVAYRNSRLSCLAQGELVMRAGAAHDAGDGIGDAALDLGDLDLDLGF
ncbi:MAG: DUF898 domain-containing protein [Myxococcales bacterium]|nr:DUF898 domain-containing protein [Myxococcales bacterium]